MSETADETDLDRTPDDNEVLGVVESMLGANRVRVRCMDGEVRTCRIPGRMQKKEWIRDDDTVIVEPWDWQDEKADIVHRYDQNEAAELFEQEDDD